MPGKKPPLAATFNKGKAPTLNVKLGYSSSSGTSTSPPGFAGPGGGKIPGIPKSMPKQGGLPTLRPVPGTSSTFNNSGLQEQKGSVNQNVKTTASGTIGGEKVQIIRPGTIIPAVPLSSVPQVKQQVAISEIPQIKNNRVNIQKSNNPKGSILPTKNVRPIPSGPPTSKASGAANKQINQNKSGTLNGTLIIENPQTGRGAKPNIQKQNKKVRIKPENTISGQSTKQTTKNIKDPSANLNTNKGPGNGVTGKSGGFKKGGPKGNLNEVPGKPPVRNNPTQKGPKGTGPGENLNGNGKGGSGSTVKVQPTGTGKEGGKGGPISDDGKPTGTDDVKVIRIGAPKNKPEQPGVKKQPPKRNAPGTDPVDPNKKPPKPKVPIPPVPPRRPGEGPPKAVTRTTTGVQINRRDCKTVELAPGVSLTAGTGAGRATIVEKIYTQRPTPGVPNPGPVLMNTTVKSVPIDTSSVVISARTNTDPPENGTNLSGGGNPFPNSITPLPGNCPKPGGTNVSITQNVPTDGSQIVTTRATMGSNAGVDAGVTQINGAGNANPSAGAAGQSISLTHQTVNGTNITVQRTTDGRGNNRLGGSITVPGRKPGHKVRASVYETRNGNLGGSVGYRRRLSQNTFVEAGGGWGGGEGSVGLSIGGTW